MQIVKYKSIDKGCLKASFQIYMPEWSPGITIRDCKLFQKGSDQWVQLPARQYEMDGQTKNYDFLFFDEGGKTPFQEKVLSLLADLSLDDKKDFSMVEF